LIGKDLVSFRDLEKKDVEHYFKAASQMEKNLKTGKKLVKNKVVATLFFEASTRTKLSFQTAAERLGCNVIDFGVAGSSLEKGESLADTIKILDGYADVLVMRHPLEGSVRLAGEMSKHPVINGGDGGNQHPTQTLLDLYTIIKEKKKINGVSVHLVGDLKHARTMRSLLYGLGMFGADVTLVAPRGLEMDPGVIKEVHERFGVKAREISALDVRGADVLYVCRIQKERFLDPYEAQKVVAEFRINEDALVGAKHDMIIMHPLPKIDEIPASMDESPHARYFEQARNGVPMRMAVINEALNYKKER